MQHCFASFPPGFFELFDRFWRRFFKFSKFWRQFFVNFCNFRARKAQKVPFFTHFSSFSSSNLSIFGAKIWPFLAPNLPLCGPLETKFSKFSKFWRQKSPKMPQICPFSQLCFSSTTQVQSPWPKFSPKLGNFLLIFPIFLVLAHAHRPKSEHLAQKFQ